MHKTTNNLRSKKFVLVPRKMSRCLSIFCALLLLASALIAVASSFTSAAVPLEIFRRNQRYNNNQNKKGVSSSSAPSNIWQVGTGSSPVATTPYLNSLNLIVATGSGNLVNINRFSGQTNWTFTAPTTAASGSSVEYSKPVLAASGLAVFVGDSQGNLYNVGIASGSVDYSFSTNSEPISTTPVIFGTNNVIVATYTGNVFSFSLEGNGAQAWNYSIGNFVSANPVLVNNGASTLVIVPAHDGVVYALDATTGKLVWRTATQNYRPVSSSCALDANNKLYCAIAGGQVLKLNTTSGSIDWNVRIHGSPAAAPVLSADGSKIYFPADFTKLYALNTADGSVAWVYDNKNEYLQTAAGVDPVSGNVIFATASTVQPTLVAVSGTTGTEAWKITAGNAGDQIVTGVAVDNNGIYFGTASGIVYAYNV